MTKKPQKSFTSRLILVILGLIVIIICFAMMGHFLNAPLPRLSTMTKEEAAALFYAPGNAYPVLVEAVNMMPSPPEAAEGNLADLRTDEVLPAFYHTADTATLTTYFDSLAPTIAHLRRAGEYRVFIRPFAGAIELPEDSLLDDDALHRLMSLLTARARFALDHEQDTEVFLEYFQLHLLLDRLLRQDVYHDLPDEITALHAFTPEDFRHLAPPQQRRLLRYLHVLTPPLPDGITLLESTHYRADSDIFQPSPFAPDRTVITENSNWQDKWRLRRGMIHFFEKQDKYEERVVEAGWKVERRLRASLDNPHIPAPQRFLMERLLGLRAYRDDFTSLQLLLALEKFHWNTGKYPESLEQLVPGYVPEMPHEAWYDVPYGYRLTEAGYVLYSCGKNLENDGGLYTIDEEGQVENLDDDRIILAPDSAAFIRKD